MNGFSAALDVLGAFSGRGGKRRDRGAGRRATRPLHLRNLRLETLEDRTLLNGTVEFDHIIFRGLQRNVPVLPWGNRSHVAAPQPLASSPPGTALAPVQIRTAYGINSISGDGTGQTIAIIDAYDDPTIASDLAAFDAQYSLPACSFTKLNENGVDGSYPTAAGTTGWLTEIALDVEWSHAIAPGASIVLVEANTPSTLDLVTAVNTARSLAGVSVVSMSWGAAETGSGGLGNMIDYESYFTTPAGHTGVTFLASTGDDGSSGEWPSLSSNVVAVGGTSLTINGATFAYVSETAWSNSYGASNGGQSAYEIEPSYQSGVQSSGFRQTPDVSFDADPATGVAVYDSYGYSVGLPNMSSPWVQVGGTSLAAPCWAGLVAIADQLRAAQGLGTLNGREQTLQALYALPAADFHDITSGSNDGFSAGPGYDEVTGRGTPVANLLVPALAATTLTVSSPYLGQHEHQSRLDLHRRQRRPVGLGHADGRRRRSHLGLYREQRRRLQPGGRVRQQHLNHLLGHNPGDQLYRAYRRDTRFLAMAGSPRVRPRPRLRAGLQQRVHLDHDLVEPVEHAD